jgi:hypothetical protein
LKLNPLIDPQILIPRVIKDKRELMRTGSYIGSAYKKEEKGSIKNNPRTWTDFLQR